MVVDLKHRTEPPATARDAMLDRLREAAEERFDEPWMIDPDRRTIPDHWHAHARPAMLGEKVCRLNAADGSSFWIKRSKGEWRYGDLPEGVEPSPEPIRWGPLEHEVGVHPEEWQPGTWKEGVWREYEGPLVPTFRGLHVARRHDLVYYLAGEVWEAEVEGEVAVGHKQVVAHRVRVNRRFDTWTPSAARNFACDVAEQVLPLWEAVTDNPAPRAELTFLRP
ncbi:MAG: hypothetical protein H0U86_15060 [Chloroflexi bacterium]|nr:hypothetical protein [Chloroflexota bacterium]